MITTKKQDKGFSLVELMVVLVILGIVSIGAMTAITGQSKVYHSEEDLVEMQMNAKVAMDRTCFLLRMAGINCNDSFGSKLISGNLVTNGDVAANPLTAMFTITNNAPPTSDQLTLVGAIRYVGRISEKPTATDKIKLACHEPPKLKSAVSANSYIVITPQATNLYRTVSAISNTTTTPTLTLAKSFDNDEFKDLIDAFDVGVAHDVYQVQAFTIRLVNNSLRIDDNVSGSSTMLDVADNIQDLQFQYGIDTDSDGQINSWVDDTTDIHKIKAIRVFILARTAKIDREYTDTKTYTLAGTDVGPFNDHVHRYLLENTISVRNRNF